MGGDGSTLHHAGNTFTYPQPQSIPATSLPNIRYNVGGTGTTKVAGVGVIVPHAMTYDNRGIIANRANARQRRPFVSYSERQQYLASKPFTNASYTGIRNPNPDQTGPYLHYKVRG